MNGQAANVASNHGKLASTYHQCNGLSPRDSPLTGENMDIAWLFSPLKRINVSEEVMKNVGR
jgi:hypothetical protein